MLDVEISNEAIEAAGRLFARAIDEKIMRAIYENNQWFTPKETKSMYGLMQEIIQYIWKIEPDFIWGKEMNYMTKSAGSVKVVTFERDACRTTDRGGAIDLYLCGYFDGQPFDYLGTISAERVMLNAIPNEVNVETMRASAGSINITIPPGAKVTPQSIAQSLKNYKRGGSGTVQNPGSGQGCACGDPFCTGCANKAQGSGAAAPLGQIGYAMGGVVPSNTVPQLTPGGALNPAAYSNLQAINNGSYYNKTRTLDAYDVLKEIEPYIDCKIGMLSGCNFLVFRFTIPDRDNWQERVKEKMVELNAKLGDKIGNLGDQKIVGLDEPYDPDGGPAFVQTSSATGKVAVHIARRDSYAAYKVTILALVKA